jgi:hypothetical protein
MGNGISRSWIFWHDNGDWENEVFMDLRIEIDLEPERVDDVADL